MNSLEKEMIARIEDIGRAHEKLKHILDHDIFDTLSKHDPYWHSENEPESEKLHEIRMKVSFLHDSLGDLYEILIRDGE